MSAIKSIFARLRRDKRGATMVEYSVLIALVTIGTIGMISAVGGKITTNWTTLNTDMTPPAAGG
jgi:pilus assembly protein Flp/PilA